MGQVRTLEGTQNANASAFWCGLVGYPSKYWKAVIGWLELSAKCGEVRESTYTGYAAEILCRNSRVMLMLPEFAVRGAL